MSADAQQVVEQFNEIVKPEGGAVEMLTVDGGVLRVRYVPGTNEECASCVLTADELRDMAAAAPEPKLDSGRQERVENLLNDYMFS